ncbi:DUF6221 family protein [Arthrobacter liuii]|uniref:Uncharacterized protein n=1 Tax=Arthrobacter liuii TaxID=1476996 RepID=A0ABQ2AMJ5_9MICC|nr:DUF6221 family protein [Arthrobacter liuii]GGH93799.1 hypothetical protein GCM10007170_15510 [Arthrobacter liuii]
MVTITEFLEARIEEDEFDANRELLWGTTPTLTRMNARILDECAAKRAIVREYQAECDAVVFTAQDADLSVAREIGLEIALGHLAAVYASHPDYRPEWGV